MTIGLIERVMRKLGLSAGEVRRDCQRTNELKERLLAADQRLTKAKEENNKAANTVILTSFKTTDRISEIRRTVQAVTARLEGERHNDKANM